MLAQYSSRCNAPIIEIDESVEVMVEGVADLIKWAEAEILIGRSRYSKHVFRLSNLDVLPYSPRLWNQHLLRSASELSAIRAPWEVEGASIIIDFGLF